VDVNGIGSYSVAAFGLMVRYFEVYLEILLRKYNSLPILHAWSGSQVRILSRSVDICPYFYVVPCWNRPVMI
jgi:hypothetical protein